jgi:hypothetical protein
MAEVSAKQLWWAFVVAGFGSRVDRLLLVVGLGVSIWQLVGGHLAAGLIVLTFLVFTYGRIPAAIAAAIVARSGREHA